MARTDLDDSNDVLLANAHCVGGELVGLVGLLDDDAVVGRAVSCLSQRC
jgi:hypothetical protein